VAGFVHNALIPHCTKRQSGFGRWLAPVKTPSTFLKMACIQPVGASVRLYKHNGEGFSRVERQTADEFLPHDRDQS
jgi:hypothetical protein